MKWSLVSTIGEDFTRKHARLSSPIKHDKEGSDSEATDAIEGPQDTTEFFWPFSWELDLIDGSVEAWLRMIGL